MKLYEKIENNNFDEIDKNRAIELIENGNGHLVYNENYFKLQKENKEQKVCIHILDDELKEINEKRKKQEIKIQELQKENEKLKESKITYEKVRDIQEKNRNIVDNKYISKQKVKDKIEKLNDESHAEELEDIMIGKNYTITELVQYVLQELIEEREEK